MVILVHVSVTCWWQGSEIRVVVGSGYQVSLRPEARDVKILAGKLIFCERRKTGGKPSDSDWDQPISAHVRSQVTSVLGGDSGEGYDHHVVLQ